MKKVVFAGTSINEYSLEASYKRAFQKLGFEVYWFDTISNQNKHIPYGKIGKHVNNFIEIKSWQKKMQKEFVLYCQTLKPDIVLVFCNAHIHFGAIAFLKSILKSKIILIWPDPLPNLESHIGTAAPLYDGIATYSQQSQDVFKSIGFKDVCWIPFAADEEIHGLESWPSNFNNDLCFVGNFRPERANDLENISKAFPKIRMSIWGISWEKYKTHILRKHIISKHLFGKDLSNLINRSRISLNIIDSTNFPSANMRFFETSIASAFQLSSACPEWENEYIDMRHLAYYSDTNDLFDKIEKILSNDLINKKIRKEGYSHTKQNHTYLHRTKNIIDRFL